LAVDFRFVAKVLGVLAAFFGLSMALPFLVALYYGDGDATAIGLAAVVTIGIGGTAYIANRKSHKEISIREGFLITASAWLVACLLGSLPFIFAGTFGSITDAVFESSSGLTTTGATVMTNIEAAPHGILFWRALTHWLGGMGIILLGIAILPLLGVGGMQLYRAEVPGPTKDRLTPRIAETAKLLWAVYVLITAAETLLLKLGGMSLFDAVCHAFATMATGGFSTRNASIASYDSVYIDFVITFFMILAGVNFALHFAALRGRVTGYWKDAEFRYYIKGLVAFTAIVTVVLFFSKTYDGLFASFRYAVFQVPAIMTTTGFCTADFEMWPYFTQMLFLALMFVGGCAGSTGGSMKVMRIVLLAKSAYAELTRLVHPHAITTVKLGETVVSDQVQRSIWNFFFLFLSLFVFSSFIMAALGLDVLTAISSVAACIGNIGPGLGGVGPADNYAWIPSLGKWVLIFNMILGRLEVYTVFVCLMPVFWKK
jgi:trk/ktr system potassium uptake protein